ncbi:phosphoribosylaminoimidazole-succinocarboxamide synthase [Liquorilactobacillus aquaticus DSM 21051]|uniref:Phosphoribosylaminoimidazole-succinocarboxamide synthase n=1 Tax=Liquorilactobacillus aquaticus DSM 21051 TaxID=1423725 RepID=A0A0R2D7Y7_9LACO|nr:phosphoribosylaminoimidazolesuccinocarboxamide synthase [Liquorilactobacillus aquaticus]KRM96662.1 phosphoribosylaminoimidazole-succinocarboxamide synthase [Liquorilactobacillus aquaticus DSM 21051]
MDKLVYSGKAKQMWTTDDDDILRVIYMDQATALNGKKKDQIAGKGKLNNQISTLIFEYLTKKGIKTHFIRKISDTEELVRKVNIVPLEMVTRNIAAGHFSTRFGIKEGLAFETSVEEMYFKSDELDDPFINESQAKALNVATHNDLSTMWAISREVNKLLTELFKTVGLQLVDFKLEFGKTKDGEIILADEFSPDNCRLWDLKNKQHMDKDVYRRNLGDLTSVYKEVLERLQKQLGGSVND